MEQVVYLDDSVEVYNINTGEFVRRYDKLAGTIIDVIELPEIDKTILSLAGGAYLLNGDKEIVSFMEGFECYKGSTDSFILSKFSTLYEVPRYDLDELHGMMQ